MTEANKKIWGYLEENVGRCILYKEAVMKEVLGEETLSLQFATLCIPEKVEAFLEGNEIKFLRKENGTYTFQIEGRRIELRCYDTKLGLEKVYEIMFSRPLRCENFGINIMGQFNKNIDAYKDLLARELHLASADIKLNDFPLAKIMRYVMNEDYTVGDDILNYIKNNNVFEGKIMLTRFLGIFADYVRKNKCSWKSMAEALKLIDGKLPSKDFIKYTAGLKEEVKNDKFIRNYLYNLFIALDMNSQDLRKVIPNDPTLQYFDSLTVNAFASLRKYDVYMTIKKDYGEEFLEILMDVQESIAMSFGEKYERVSEESFDMGERFFKNERFWSPFEEIINSSAKPENTESSTEEEEPLNVGEGTVTNWTSDEFVEENYSEKNEVQQKKKYLDDEEPESEVESGLNIAGMDSYEEDNLTDDKEESKCVTPSETSVHNEEIMNSQRGHESKVLNSGGV